MKTFTKIALGAAMVVMGMATATAQNALEDPRYGATPEERKTNLGNLNWLSDEVSARNWDAAAAYVRQLMKDAPAAPPQYICILIWRKDTTIGSSI